MAGKNTFTPNRNGLAKLRSGPGVIAMLQGKAENVARAAEAGSTYKPDAKGETGFLTDTTISKGPSGRARTSVRTVGIDAMLVEATEKRLLRSLDEARG